MQADQELFANTFWPRSTWWITLLLVSRCPFTQQAPHLVPDPLLNVAQERDLSNVDVVVENGLSLRCSSFPAALTFKPPDPDPNTSVSETWVPCDSARKWVGRQGEWLLCSRLIRFHRTLPNDQSVGLYTQPSVRACVRVCMCVCGFYCTGRVKASVVCLGQRT